ncbi:hypothetical protein C8A05DRAFT_15582, partial [Staphylotrichum tortipilum]
SSPLPAHARAERPRREQAQAPEQDSEQQAEQNPEDEAQSDAPSPSPSSSHSEGEYSGSEAGPDPAEDAQPPLPNKPLPDGAPPLPNEPLPTDPSAPPLPAEPLPEPEDDGWEFHWNPNDQSYWFYNRFTGAWQKENPRVPVADAATTTPSTSTAAAAAPADPTTSTPTPTTTTTLSNPASISGGYNPAIHGSYDENAWYAQGLRPPSTTTLPPSESQSTADDYTSTALFNRLTGQYQTAEQGTERHTDEAKARRQMRAFFDVDAAANMHDGRSLKAERSGIKPSKAELKVFKERRRAKKEEKRRAWLRD